MEIQTIDQHQLSTMTNDDLKRELSRGLSITAEYLSYLASIWQELTRRGVNLSDLRHGLMEYLPAIANKLMHPELVINYAGQKTLLAALSRLPYSAQNDFAKNGFVSVAKIDGDGSQEVQASLSDLTAADVYRIFGEGYVRTPAEQYKHSLLQQKKPKKITRKTSNVKLDTETGMVKVSNNTVDPKLLLTVLGELYGVDLHQVIGAKDGTR